MFGFKTYKKIKVINRFNQILLAFLGLGFGHLIHKAGLRRHLPFFKRLSPDAAKAADAKELSLRFRRTLERLGPVFVKFGQILSTRSDLLPREYISELQHLQSHVPPFSFAQARRIIETNFNKPIEQVFQNFNHEPFAAASLGQVYQANLKTGEKVAVKVQRPGAKAQIKIDIQVLYLYAHLIEKYAPSTRAYDLKGIIDEFAKWTLNELDYRKEAANCEIFSNFFKDDPNIYSPKVYWDYSAESVLTLEFIEGESLRQVVANKLKTNHTELAGLIGDAFIKQCFDYGFFHADPHPGNIFVIEKTKLMFLDFGMVGFLDNRLATLATSMFLSLLQKDIENLVTLLMQIQENYSDKKKNKDANEVDVNSLRKELNQLVIQWPMSAKQSGGFTRLFYELMNTATRNGISVPTDLIMLSKAIVTLDRVVLDLDPKFQLEKWEQPLLEKIIQKRLGPKNLQSKAQTAAIVFEDLLEKLPENSSKILSNLEKSRSEMGLTAEELIGYERLLRANSRLSTFGIIGAAMILAAAFMYDSSPQLMIGSWPIPQVLLFTGIGLIVILFLSNLRKGKI